MLPRVSAVLSIPRDTPQEDEVLGGKPKFWFQGPDRRRWLFKWSPQPREDVVELWAYHLGLCLGLPVAKVVLAEHDSEGGLRLGIASPSFLRADESLVHGNELLVRKDPNYPHQQSYKVFGYTPGLCLQAIEFVPRAAEQFVGYLLFDAWIGNQDRHHQNWGVVEGSGRLALAPSYDHAAALGKHESEANAHRRLSGADPRVSVQRYAEKARSAFYQAGQTKPLHPIRAFVSAAILYPEAGLHWLDQLERVSDSDVVDVLNRPPAERISQAHRAFAARLLSWTRDQLLKEARSVIRRQRSI